MGTNIKLYCRFSFVIYLFFYAVVVLQRPLTSDHFIHHYRFNQIVLDYRPTESITFFSLGFKSKCIVLKFFDQFFNGQTIENKLSERLNSGLVF